MSDEEIARLTLPELLEIIKRLLGEVELRAMELAEQKRTLNQSLKTAQHTLRDGSAQRCQRHKTDSINLLMLQAAPRLQTAIKVGSLVGGWLAGAIQSKAR